MVTNITDVDDKINAKAADEGVEIDAITKRYTKCYHEDLAALGCIAPDVELKATEHMPVMIAMISAIWLIASEITDQAIKLLTWVLSI
jgi:cysteinyl-tRNA synthetase